jgi:hypothetical protein
MGNVKRIVYKGNNKSLVSGNTYTFKEFADVAGVSYRCFVSRAYGKRFISDKELEPLNSHKIPNCWKNKPNISASRHDTQIGVICQKWLSKNL